MLKKLRFCICALLIERVYDFFFKLSSCVAKMHECLFLFLFQHTVKGQGPLHLCILWGVNQSAVGQTLFNILYIYSFYL